MLGKLVLTLLSVVVLRRLVAMGIFSDPIAITKFTDCTPVKGAPGAEDAVIDHRSGLMFMSSADWRAKLASRPAAYKSGIYLLDMATMDIGRNVATPKRLELVDYPGTDMHFHGLGMYRAGSGAVTIMVVNHLADNDVVDVFRFDQSATTLRHVQRVSHPSFVSLNDVVPIDSTRFYATNDHIVSQRGFGGVFLHIASDLSGLSAGNIVYYDGKTAEVVSDRVAFPNGIEIAGDRVVVGGTFEHAILSFRHDETTNRLVEDTRIPVGGMVDNIAFDERGDLWTASHTNALKFLQNGQSADAHAPYVVSRIAREATLKSSERFRSRPDVERIHSSLGDDLSAVASAVPYKNYVVLTPVFDEHILVCRLPSELYA